MRSLETLPGGYGDGLADGERAKQWAVVVGFALEAAQLSMVERGSFLIWSKAVVFMIFFS